MKKLVIFALLISMLLLTFTAANTFYNRTIEVRDGITILIDGEVFEPKDVNGDPVEVFVYDGTTYVPIRALTEKFGKTVKYDDETDTASIDTPENSLILYTYFINRFNDNIKIVNLCDKIYDEVYVEFCKYYQDLADGKDIDTDGLFDKTDEYFRILNMCEKEGNEYFWYLYNKRLPDSISYEITHTGSKLQSLYQILTMFQFALDKEDKTPIDVENVFSRYPKDDNIFEYTEVIRQLLDLIRENL